jgi:hypothetical protein
MAVNFISAYTFEFPRRSYSMSRLSFCLSSFGALINQPTATGRPFGIVSSLTNNSHPGTHDSDGHFRAGIA